MVVCRNVAFVNSVELASSVAACLTGIPLAYMFCFSRVLSARDHAVRCSRFLDNAISLGILYIYIEFTSLDVAKNV